MYNRDFLFTVGIIVTVLLHVLTTTQISFQRQSSSSSQRRRQQQLQRVDKFSSEVTPSARLDYIDRLPGLHYDPGFKQYSGYFDVSSTRHLFYWFVESQGNPATDPVLFWTNGGPGCSGFIGLGEEHGPFIFDEKGELSANPYSWNKFANILYIEQPAGVGFSYGESEDDLALTTGDQQAARDNYKFIQRFFERFPEMKSNPFYISSESYGGHYIPQLANEILNNNKGGAINFQGFLVGNPYVDPYSNMVAQMDTIYYHGLVSKPHYERWKAACLEPDWRKMTLQCREILDEIYNNPLDETEPYDLYALDYPVCLPDDSIKIAKKPKVRSMRSSPIMNKYFPLRESRRSYSFSLQGAMLLNKSASSPPFLPVQDVYRPCSGLYVENYFLRSDVREALHVRNESAARWSKCSDINYSTDDILTSTIPLYRDLVFKGAQGHHSLNMLVFSGDDDSVCPTSGTQDWIWNLGVNVTADHFWKIWRVDGQTAGFYTNFDLGHTTKASLSFATVRGAGHEVPACRPMEALELLRLFFSGEKW